MNPRVNTAIYNFPRISELSSEISEFFLLWQKENKNKKQREDSLRDELFYLFHATKGPRLNSLMSLFNMQNLNI